MTSLERIGHRVAPAVWLLWLAMGPAPSSAQTEPLETEMAPDHAPEVERSRLPLRLSERPLTLPRGKVSLVSTLGFDLYRSDVGECIMTLSGESCPTGVNDSRTFVRSTSGLAVGVIDALEVGLFPVRYSHRRDPLGGTELDVFDPLLYLEAAAFRSAHFQLGFGYQLFLPLQSESTALRQSLTLDLLARSRFVRVDASAVVGFASPIRTSARGRTIVTPGFDLRATGQLADPFALWVSFRHRFFDSEARNYTLSVGAGVVGSLRRANGEPYADLAFSFGVVQVVRPEDRFVPGTLILEPDGALPAGTSLYTVDLSATFYFHDAW